MGIQEIKKELHLIIIWEKARKFEPELVQEIESKFTVVCQYEFSWDKSEFSNNLSRFYGIKLPKNSGKEEHCGIGPFLCLIVEDGKPQYGYKETSRGREYVNINIFETKNKLREISGGGHRVHATNTNREYDHDCTLLFGLGYTHKENKNRIKIARNIEGSSGWSSLNQVINVLNNTCNYLVLRNFEDLLLGKFDKHSDIDLLVENPEDVSLIMNAKKIFSEDYRVHYSIRTAKNGQVFFDLRYLGDGYYDKNWELAMINNRIFSKKYSAYIMDEKNILPSLIYHALVHKIDISSDYKKYFEKHNKLKTSDKSKLLNFLAHFMAKQSYKATLPDDRSVLFQNSLAKKLNIKILSLRIYSKLLIQKRDKFTESGY